jgi:hypothetical protein
MQPIWEKETYIQKRIAAAFGDNFEEKTAHDIAFHMTDWLSDIKGLEDIYSNVDSLTNEEIRSFVCGFLAHVPNHLNAAAKLSGVGKVEDVFEVGIFDDDP